MTTIYLSGAENPSHQTILRDAGAKYVAVNVGSLLRRPGSWSLDFPYKYEWVAFTDAPCTLEELQGVVEQASQPPRYVVGPSDWSEWGEGYIPLWNGVGELPAGPTGLVVTDSVIKKDDTLRRSLGARTRGSVLGVVTGTSDSVIGKFDIVVSSAWWSVMKYGETQVWDGKKLRRYNADNAQHVRERHVEDIESLGISAEEVLRKDPNELAKLAVVSWRMYADYLSGSKILDITSRIAELQADDSPIHESGFTGSGSDSLAIDPVKTRHEHTTLPVVGVEVQRTPYRLGDGTETAEEQVLVRTPSTTVRRCDNCVFASSGCPGYDPGAACAYSIPVELRTRDQLQALMAAVTEMQAQRVFMARFAEELTGQELSKDVGREVDRLFHIIEKTKNISDNRDTLKVSVEAKSSAGVLSRLFGSGVGENARQLSKPMDADDIIDQLTDGG